ncbi:ATPase family AAA domain-containing protein 1-B [Kryptolebias marmoratus]|uniref:ATPase family AAA domain-containing protein 1-B n=1 Tax=Kryptolebias marmoratus TaxID=37003 RepID=UPI0018ACA36D|nr:ATPase family AAA domain-containing protein 1-B [Kryptolebias marmoratus]
MWWVWPWVWPVCGGCGLYVVGVVGLCRVLSLVPACLQQLSLWTDSFLRNRSTSDHEATAMMKAQFMSLWDGLDTDHHCQVIIMGATNRPQDLDSAILRRMPTRFHINQPSVRQREQILRLILDNERVDSTVDLKDVAKETDGFSGSDLREMCRDAALLCVRDFVHNQSDSVSEDTIRPIAQTDLQTAVSKMKQSKTAGGQGALLHAALD